MEGFLGADPQLDRGDPRGQEGVFEDLEVALDG